MTYDHEWKTQSSGCSDNFWWLQFWKTQENYKRFQIPEFKRNTARWDFLGEQSISLVNYNNFK